VKGHRRRYGAHIVHLGMVLMTLGITGSSIYQHETLATLSPGEEIAVQSYVIQYKDLETEESEARQTFTAVMDISRSGRQIGSLNPQRNFYWSMEQWLTEVAVRSTLREDLYISLTGIQQDGRATFQFLVNPLVIWLWIGGAVLLLGGSVAWWPSAPQRGHQ